MLPVLVLASWLAGSAPPTPAVELRWDAPAGCPQQEAIERQIAALQRGRPAPTNPPRVAFRVEPRGDRWHLVGEISGTTNNGTRELSAATCAELAEAAVLITAIAIDPEPGAADPMVPAPAAPTATEAPPATGTPTTTGTPPTTGAPPATEAPPAPVTSEPPTPAPPPRPAAPRRRPGATLGLAAGLGLAALTAPSGLLRLALGLRGERWSLALTQDFWLPRSIDAASAAFGGRFWLWAAGLRGCGIVRAGPVEVPLCATIAAGVMTGTGIGALSTATTRRSPWAAVAVGPGLRVPIGRRLGLVLSAELLAILARPRFEITDRGVICCGATLGGQFTAGLEIALGRGRAAPGPMVSPAAPR